MRCTPQQRQHANQDRHFRAENMHAAQTTCMLRADMSLAWNMPLYRLRPNGRPLDSISVTLVSVLCPSSSASPSSSPRLHPSHYLATHHVRQLTRRRVGARWDGVQASSKAPRHRVETRESLAY